MAQTTIPILSIHDILRLVLDPASESIQVSIVSGVGGTEYTEDGALGAAGTGTLALARRDDALSALTPVENDAVGLRVDANGALWTHDDALDAALSGSELQVDVVAALPAGDNNIGNVDVASLPKELSGPGTPNIDSYTTKAISAAANTADQELVAAPGASKQIWVYGIVLTADTGDGSVSLQDSDNTAASGVMAVVENGGFAINPSGNFAMPWIKVATNKALEIDTVTCGAKGILTYAIVSV